MIIYPHPDLVPPEEWPWTHFTPAEMACRATQAVKVYPEFMWRLERLRQRLGFAMPVTSGYRSPEHNRQVSTTGYDGPHTTGRAADIRAFGEQALRLIAAAFGEGMTGIGVKQHGPRHLRFVHLDDLPDAPGCPRPWIWSYP